MVKRHSRRNGQREQPPRPHRGGTRSSRTSGPSFSDWQIVPLKAAGLRLVESACSEWVAWQRATARATTSAVDDPLSDEALVAVLRRAFVADFGAQRHPDWWPDGPIDPPVDDLASYISRRSLLTTTKALFAEVGLSPPDAVSKAIKIYDKHYTIRVLGQRVGGRYGSNELVTLLNACPRSDTIAARILAPVVRRIVPRAVGPRWYFRCMGEIERGKRTRPFLLPVDYPPHGKLSIPSNYGWDALESWLLKVYLFDGRMHRSKERLAALVQYATGCITTFVEKARDEGPLAVQFDALCSSLRRFLFWHASMALGDRDYRRFTHGLLRQLQNAIVPHVPAKEPLVLLPEHGDHYHNWLRAVRQAWSVSRGDRTRAVRRRELEDLIDFLGFLSRTESHVKQGRFTPKGGQLLISLRERFWRDCGDLYAMRPSEFTRRAVMFVGAFVGQLPEGDSPSMERWVEAAQRFNASYRQLQFEPQAMKEAMARMDKAPFLRVQRVRLGESVVEDPVFVP